MEVIAMICHKCNQPGYKQVLEGWLCRQHYVIWLEALLGPWTKYSNEYQKAVKDGYQPTPLFEMEQIS
jgi:hypothetical protein